MPDFRGRRWLHRAAYSLLAMQAALLAWSGWVHSPVVDEIAYLPAGISHWQLGSFELASVSPPLVRLCAAVPVLLFGEPVTSWGSISIGSGSRPEWQAGPQFVELNGSRIFWLCTLGRWGCLPFAVLGGVVCWRWAREAYGEWAGFISISLWSVCPNILGHGALLTPDVGGAATGALAGYLYWRWLQKPGGWRACGAGLGLGLALLARTTWVVLIPLWICGWLASLRFAPQRLEPIRRRSLWGMCGVIGIAIYVVNLGYAFEGSCEPLGKFTFVSRTLTGRADAAPGNRFAGTWLGRIPVPLPRDLIKGIDLQRRDFEEPAWSFLAGETKNGGWWYFYLYGLAVKLPLGVWGLVLLVSALSMTGKHRRNWSSEAVLLVPIVVVLLLASSQTSFSRHVRYVYGILPFLYVWISQAARVFAWQKHGAAAAVCILLAWQAVSSLSVYPHSLSYFNEMAGGPRNGFRILVNSGSDWGQDLLYFKRWYREHVESGDLYLAYYGRVNPALAGIAFKPPPMRDELPPGQPVSGALAPGWYAISATLLQGRPYTVFVDGAPDQAAPADAFSFFRDLEPVDRVGYSILIYRVVAESRRPAGIDR